MIGLLLRVLGWLSRALRHVETGHDQPKGAWEHTYNDLDPSTKLPSATIPEADEAPEHRAHIDAAEAATARTEWTDEHGRKFKRFADGQVGEDITELDITNVDELRRVYGPARIISDDKLVQWAQEAKGSVQDPVRQAELRKRLTELESEALTPPVDDGYRPVSGINAGTSPKTGVVLPPKVDDLTTQEWVTLKLEQAYGKGAVAMPAGAGYSMRYLNQLHRKAEMRAASAYELSILRSRGLV